MVAIACGHEDCDDLDVLRHDPALRIACDKRPDADVGLASQPTLSRLENAVSWRMLARMGLGMIALWLGEQGKGAATLMRPGPTDTLRWHRVDRRVNSNRAAGPDLIDPLDDMAD